jgi:maleate cis-trans isomerase
MVASAESAERLLAMAEPEAMIFACSSASFYKGPGWDKKVAARVRKGGKVPATTTATAIADGLKALGARRTVLVTPYPDATNRAEIAFLRGNGIDVADYSTFDCRLSTDVPRVTPAEIRRRVLEGMKKVPDCDAVIVTCTNLRAMQIAEDLEQEVGRPVVTSNAASLWALLRLAGIATRGIRAGRLFRQAA